LSDPDRDPGQADPDPADPDRYHVQAKEKADKLFFQKNLIIVTKTLKIMAHLTLMRKIKR
jgi:hypothetical protein